MLRVNDHSQEVYKKKLQFSVQVCCVPVGCAVVLISVCSALNLQMHMSIVVLAIYNDIKLQNHTILTFIVKILRVARKKKYTKLMSNSNKYVMLKNYH